MSTSSRCLVLASAVLLSLGSLPAQLAGGYTINPARPASATNFTTLASAVAALVANGVAGPVFFDVYDDAGPYKETATFSAVITPTTAGLVLGTWNGASSTNRVTFRAAPGESPVIDAAPNGMGVFWN